MDLKYTGDFREGLAQVRYKGQDEFINKKGDIFYIKKSYNTSDCSNGLIKYYNKNNNKIGYLDKKGNVKIKAQYEHGDSFENNMTSVRLNGKYGLINKENEWIIEPKFNNPLRFYKGYAIVSKGEIMKGNYLEGIINIKGEIVLDYKYESLSHCINTPYFKVGFTPYKIIDINENIIINGNNYDSGGYWLSNLNEGIITMVVRSGGEYGKTRLVGINIKGKVIFDNNYDTLYYLNEGMFCYSRINHWEAKDKRINGLLTKDGKYIIKNLFSNIYGFNDGLAIVEYGKNNYNERFGVINKNGDFAIKPVVKNRLQGFSEGLCRVGTEGFINKKGCYVLGKHKGKHIEEIYSHHHEDIPKKHFDINNGCLDFNRTKRPTNKEQIELNNQLQSIWRNYNL